MSTSEPTHKLRCGHLHPGRDEPCGQLLAGSDRPMRRTGRTFKSVDYHARNCIVVWCKRCKRATEYEYADTAGEAA